MRLGFVKVLMVVDVLTMQMEILPIERHVFFVCFVLFLSYIIMSRWAEQIWLIKKGLRKKENIEKENTLKSTKQKFSDHLFLYGYFHSTKVSEDWRGWTPTATRTHRTDILRHIHIAFQNRSPVFWEHILLLLPHCCASHFCFPPAPGLNQRDQRHEMRVGCCNTQFICCLNCFWKCKKRDCVTKWQVATCHFQKVTLFCCLPFKWSDSTEGRTALSFILTYKIVSLLRRYQEHWGDGSVTCYCFGSDPCGIRPHHVGTGDEGNIPDLCRNNHPGSADIKRPDTMSWAQKFIS